MKKWIMGIAAALNVLSFAQAKEKPNILFIIADDLGPQLGCYGDATARTPHIDRLAAEGVRFDNGYVTTASCSPSRGSMMTGLYPHQHGMMGLSHFGTERMHDDVPKLTIELKKLGYATASIGKTHFLPLEPFRFDYYNEDMRKVADDRDVLWMNERAGEFLDSLEGNQPFFLIMSYIDPHRGHSDDGVTYATGNLRFPRVKLGLPENPTPEDEVVPMPFLGLDSPEIRMEQADYYGAVDRLDIGVGDLRARMEARGFWEDTLVILVGDHGPDVTRGKMSVCESAVRIPYIAAGPGVARGLVRKEFVSTIDLFPTFLQAAGARRAVVDARQAGLPLQPLFRPGAPAWRERIFTEFITHVPWHFYPRYTVREGDWKLVFNHFGGERENPLGPENYCFAWPESRKPAYRETPVRHLYDRVENPPRLELYDLANDPFEVYNLADDPLRRRLRDRMLAEIDAWRRQTADPFLDPAMIEMQDRKGRDFREAYLARLRPQPAAKAEPSAPGKIVEESFVEDFTQSLSREWASPNQQPARIGPDGMTGSLNQNGFSMATLVGGGEAIGAGRISVSAGFAQSPEAAPHPIHWAVGFSSGSGKYLQNTDADTVCVRFVTAGPNRGRLWWSVYRDGIQVASDWSGEPLASWNPGEELRLSLAYNLDTGQAVASVNNVATGNQVVLDYANCPGIGGFRHAGVEATMFPGGVDGKPGAVMRFTFTSGR